ncbi:MAG: hypothetical protein EBQ92_08725 [Proteobacteria bacterium]|nr:hypothetical protein [Pseudomonadota bacterium]
MTWVIDEKILVKLSASEARKIWAEEKAFDVFHELQSRLKPEHQEKSRIGALGFQAIQGTEGLHTWLFPIEGHPKILGFKNPVQILSFHGEVLFEGLWGDTPLALIEKTEEFFIWLPYRHGSKPEKLGLKTRLLGVFRYFKNRKKKP